MVVVEFQRRNACRVCLKTEDEDVAHQIHVLDDVLRDAVGRSLHIRFVERGSPALQLAAFARVLDPFLHLTHAVEILVELALIAGADAASQILCVGEYGVEHALVLGRGFVFKETIKGKCGVKFQRRRRGR